MAAASVLVVLGAGALLALRDTADEPELEETAASSAGSTVTSLGTTVEPIEPETDPTLVAGPLSGGTVRVGVVGGGAATFNPYLIGSDRALVPLRHLVAASAFRLHPDSHDLRPGVIDRLPTLSNGGLTVNPDGTMTVSLTIAEQAQWADGNPVRAEDFLLTHDVVTTHRAAIFPDIVAQHDRIMPGSLTGSGAEVQFTVHETGLDLAGLFSDLLPSHQVRVETFRTGWNRRSWHSAGPFQRVEAADGLIRLERNPAYELGETPLLDAIEVVAYESIADAVSALGEGEIDVAGALQDPELVAEVASTDGLIADVRRGPGWEHLGFQFGPGAVTANPGSAIDRGLIRRAILGALDREAIAAAVQGEHGEALQSIVALGWPAVDTSVWDIDPDLPGRLAGLTISLSFTGGDEHRRLIAELIVEQLAEEGVTVELVPDDPGQFFANRVLPGEFEMAEWAWASSPGPGAVAGDLLNWLTPDGRSDLDFYGWSAHAEAAEFQALATGLDGILGVEELAGRLRLVEREMAESVPLIPLYAELNVGAASRRVRAFSHSALPGGILATAASWWVADG